MSHADTGQAAQTDWTRAPERGNALLLRLMVWLSLRLGRPVGRLLLYPICFYYVLFTARTRHASRTYLNRVLPRPARFTDLFRHVFSFAATVHDRLYLLNDRFDLFDIRVYGSEHLPEQGGALLMGAHLGSFEVMRSLGRQRNLRVAMLMYEENARKVNAALAAINPHALTDIIPLGKMDSMLEALNRLETGHFVGMLADRTLGGDTLRNCQFFGHTAALPLGPFRMAAMLKHPLIFMTGLYLGGNRYEIHFDRLADFSAIPRGQREAAIRAAQDRYVELLEHYCRQAPYNWFNFFDFWHTNAPEQRL